MKKYCFPSSWVWWTAVNNPTECWCNSVDRGHGMCVCSEAHHLGSSYLLWEKKMCLEELLVQQGWEARNTTKPSDQLEGKPGWVMLKSIESQSNHRWIIGLMFIAMLLPILMQLVKCHYCSHCWLLRAPLSKAKPINVYVSICTYIKRYYCATISSKIKIFHPPRELFKWEGK